MLYFKKNLVSTAYRSNKQGYRTIGGKTYYFKSLWEIQYAQTLEWLKKAKNIKDWEYEPLTFSFPKEKYKASPFYYKPDFKVIENNNTHTWHEVKGYMNASSKAKIKRFKKHYPEEKLIIIDSKWFRANRKKNLHKIIGWESL